MGIDRPGIVQAVTAVLVAHGANVEDSQMTILRGHFAMVMVVAIPTDADADGVRADLEAVAGEIGLEALALEPVRELAAPTPEPTHLITVYGSDHPGIVHAVAEGLAQQGCSITDLNTRVGAEYDNGDGDSLYVVMVEAQVPDGRLEHVEAALDDAARAQGVEVDIGELENG